MSATLYIFRLVWPFLKELLLGGLSLKEGMKTQKKKVFLLFFVSGLILALFLIIPKFYALSQDHIKLEKSVSVENVKRLSDRIKELEDKGSTSPGGEDKPAEAIAPVIDQSPPVPPEPIKPKQKAKTKPLPVVPASALEDKNNRKTSYMDFFEKYND